MAASPSRTTLDIIMSLTPTDLLCQMCGAAPQEGTTGLCGACLQVSNAYIGTATTEYSNLADAMRRYLRDAYTNHDIAILRAARLLD